MLSKGDFVVKFWGPMFETLFHQMPALFPWGDTQSQANEENRHNSRRMNLGLFLLF